MMSVHKRLNARAYRMCWRESNLESLRISKFSKNLDVYDLLLHGISKNLERILKKKSWMDVIFSMCSMKEFLIDF